MIFCCTSNAAIKNVKIANTMNFSKIVWAMYITCSGECSSCHFETKIRSLAQFLTELLQILLLKACIMKNNTF